MNFINYNEIIKIIKIFIKESINIKIINTNFLY